MAQTKVLQRKPLSLAEKTFIPQIAGGLMTTFKQKTKQPLTLHYPHERPVIPHTYRGVPTLVKDPNGREKCVSCQLCEFVCPPKAIRITPGEIDPEAEPERAHVEKAPQEFEINMLR
ncbi:MAG: 4Fe-4S binding protein, partial [Verrucomicrobiota bacterium]